MVRQFLGACTIARITLSEPPASLSVFNAAGSVSKEQEVALILAITISAPNPALTMPTKSSFFSTKARDLWELVRTGV